MIRLRSLLAVTLGALGLGAGLLLSSRSAIVRASGAHARPEDKAQSRAPAQDPSLGPGLLPTDAFHPDRRPGKDGGLPPLPKPAYGGRVVVHTDSMPKSLCATVDGTGVTRRILCELHETLLLRDWETTEWKPDLALRWDVQDRLVPKPGVSAPLPEYLVGTVREKGDAWTVEPKPGYTTTDSVRMKKSDVESVERGSVITFHLRPGVRWHDGHPFDANDVAFSWRIYSNPQVNCGDKRDRYQKIASVEVPDFLTVRFTLAHQYYNALESLGDMCILPAHLYDLSDADNADGRARRDADPSWKPSEAEEAEYVNQNAHNREWVGLGPYRLHRWTADGVEATRFADYFDPANAGYVDEIRWRAIPDDEAAFQAVLNGEIDFFPKMTADDYFGASTQSTSFTDRLYKGYFYPGDYWYVGWNLHRPQLADVRVRRALAMLFDFEEFKRTFYKGLAFQVTGPGSVYSPGYDRGLAPLPYDAAKAAALLDEAGWTDRDGDGVREKDGVPLEIELLVQPNNKVGAAFGAKYQENLARAGIRLKTTAIEMGALLDRRQKRDFDAIALAWSPALESDPEQIWSSHGGSNYGGLEVAEVDELIGRGQRELDPAKRGAIWRELQRKIYDLQPYLFCFNPPRKFAMNRRIRGFQSVPLSPNYVIRRWYYPEGTTGTRATLAPDPAPDPAAGPEPAAEPAKAKRQGVAPKGKGK
jgi:peptide/nickel transport system substrate-binding protein